MNKPQITIKDIARALNVSPSTVSRALKDNPDISKETRDLVHAYAREHNYKPNVLAVNLRASRSNTIGVIVPQPVVFRQVFPQPHGHDPVGIPDEQIAGGFAAVRLFRIFGVVTTLSEGRQVPPSRTAVRYCSDPTFSYLCK